MDYYSRVSLSIRPVGEVSNPYYEETAERVFADVTKAGEPWHRLFYGLEQTSDEYKAYELDSEMRGASRRWPNWLFIVDRDGEDQGDRQRYYALRGRLAARSAPEWVPPEPDAEIMRELGQGEQS